MIGIGIGTHRRRFAEGAGFSNLYSMLFNGADKYVNIDSVQAGLAATTTGTWSAWIKPADLLAVVNKWIINFGDTNAATRISFYITTAGKLVGFAENATVNQWILAEDNVDLIDTQWNHVVLTQDGVSPVLYINGIAIAQTFSVSTDKTIWTNMAGLDNGRLGDSNYESSGERFFFDGNIDEVSFWNAALTGPEITELYNAGAPTDLLTHSATANLVTWYRMGDGDTFAVGVWTFADNKGLNSGSSVNMNEIDREEDTP